MYIDCLLIKRFWLFQMFSFRPSFKTFFIKIDGNLQGNLRIEIALKHKTISYVLKIMTQENFHGLPLSSKYLSRLAIF